ncbi:MAG: recombinase family protein [Ferrimicrobium sp.]
MCVGSGLNYHRRGLGVLISRIYLGEVDWLVLSHRDRLLCFASELVLSLCEQFSCEVVTINASQDSTFAENLVSDVIEIVNVFAHPALWLTGL